MYCRWNRCRGVVIISWGYESPSKRVQRKEKRGLGYSHHATGAIYDLEAHGHVSK